MKIKFGAIIMPFKEMLYDEEGNPKKTKDGRPMFAIINRIVRHNKGYFPKK